MNLFKPQENPTREIERLKDMIQEQMGTIKALNMALNGEESTSTENLIDAHEVDYAEQGLIPLCRSLTKENVRLLETVEAQKKAWADDYEEIERLKDSLFAEKEKAAAARMRVRELEAMLKFRDVDCDRKSKAIEEQSAEIERLKEQLVEAQKDATRFIALINEMLVVDIDGPIMRGLEAWADKCDADAALQTLDAVRNVIDDAMKGK